MKSKAQKTQAKQPESEAAREVRGRFEQFMREAVREAAWGIMVEEVTELCGPRHRPAPGSVHRRAGTETGVLHYEGRRESLRRPRVRTADGRREVALESYAMVRDVNNHSAMVHRLAAEGMSTRGLARAYDGALGKSRMAEAWAQKGREHIAQLRGRDLRAKSWAVLMMDGVWLDKDLCAIVAVGIDTQGAKQVLDFEVGTSESAECAARLLRRLVERGFGPVAGHRLLAVIDGAAALRKALVGPWPNILLQECLVHVERHLLDRLRRGDRDEAQGLLQRLRVAQGSQAAGEAFEELSRFLGQRHEGAQASLLEAKGRLLTVHGLGLGETLQRSLLSTNAIENVLRNWRQSSHGVSRWRREGDMASRWLSSGLLWAERGFRRIKGHEQMARLMAALKLPEGVEGGGGTREVGSSTPGSPLRSEPCVAEPTSRGGASPSKSLASAMSQHKITQPSA
jgi:transposase-like protein